MNPLLARDVADCLVPGQTYLIMNAKRMPTEKGMRLFVLLRTPETVLCKLPAGFSYLLTYPQIQRINSDKLFVKLSYFGKSLSGDPIIQIRNAILPSPTFEDMAAAGALAL